MPVKPIPEGYHSVTPYLTVHDAAKAIAYYKKAFGAKELMRVPGPGGKVMHAEVKIGDSVIMMADEFPGMGCRSPKSLGGSAQGLMVYVTDVDAVFKKAIAAGGKQFMAVTDQFYGDRSGTLEDPFGHMWTIATHKEDLSQVEIKKRMDAFMKQKGKGPT